MSGTFQGFIVGGTTFLRHVRKHGDTGSVHANLIVTARCTVAYQPERGKNVGFVRIFVTHVSESLEFKYCF